MKSLIIAIIITSFAASAFAASFHCEGTLKLEGADRMQTMVDFKLTKKLEGLIIAEAEIEELNLRVKAMPIASAAIIQVHDIGSGLTQSSYSKGSELIHVVSKDNYTLIISCTNSNMQP